MADIEQELEYAEFSIESNDSTMMITLEKSPTSASPIKVPACLMNLFENNSNADVIAVKPQEISVKPTELLFCESMTSDFAGSIF